jgi:CubicO group peptidase (beta-lactamase class C family)
MKIVAVAALALTASCASTSPVPSARIDGVVNRMLASRNIPGASVAIVHGDRLVFARGYGIADRERGSKVTERTIFQLASTTKPFTAMCVLMLADEKKLELDAPAARYLSWLPPKYATITIRQLLTHTSGVARDLRRENIDEFSAEEFQRRLEAAPVSFPPGAKWEYANTGYSLLSFIVEAVAKQPFAEVLGARIFAPLQMTSTAYRAAEKPDDIHAVGYDMADGKLVRAPHAFSGFGNSGIESSAVDVAKWAIALQHRRLLSEASYEAMFSPGTLANGKPATFDFRNAPTGYGFGWFITIWRGTRLLTHGGAVAGFSSIVDRYPDAGWTIIVLSNGKQGADRLGQAEALSHAIASELGIGH